MPEHKSRTLVSFRDGSYKEIECDAWKHSQWIHFTCPDGSKIHVNPENVNYLHERPRPKTALGSAYQRGSMDYSQDRCEGAMLASVGGEKLVRSTDEAITLMRAKMTVPDYVQLEDHLEYRNGYCDAAKRDGWTVRA